MQIARLLRHCHKRDPRNTRTPGWRKSLKRWIFLNILIFWQRVKNR
jgi:hypothetical protein